ncbi:DUF885 domain-containing protein [Pseudohaliea rubra]|uniref:DUF885 domain-containing protein n=1 Tax=Pseudohaliea rubra DSM 19751 TaxID=1265313 RepID=A0A095XZH7_9GAMM|nr:DUF885 family protein [Pseudohaliea rubra]KGE05161.1 hypothetical protein HRUBRA_00205 [Pseudohaliea rubra DSM 19751]
MVRVLFLGLLLTVAGCATNTGTGDASANERLRALYEREFAWRQGEEGYRRREDGDWERGPVWPDVSPGAQARRLAYWEQALAELATIPRDALSEDEQVNAAVFEEIISALVSNARFRSYEAPLNSDTFFWGGLHPRGSGFDDESAYRRYLARLRDLPRYFAQQQANMRAGLARGYTPPAVTLKGREQSILPYLARGRANPFWEPLEGLPGHLDDATREALRDEALIAIDEAVVPAYGALLAFLREEYLPGARRSLAARDLPDGEAFYRAQIRRFTTLDLDPKTIHETGLAEVARIRAEMLAVKDDAGFEGDLDAFIAFLRTDPQFVADSPEELLGVSAYVAKRMDGHLDEVLGFLPRRRFTIRPVPDAIAPFYTGGRGGLEACLMNTYDLPSRPLYNIPALTLHECAPGHALQAAIALEAPGSVPEFRARNYFSGYGEGWGLYTEWLGKEFGIYRTPYEDFGRLSYEMWRACRLVIDTGVHYFGWSREQALDYLARHTALSTHEVTTEVDRYISWPAQALAYKLGELLIREKRTEAEQVLGADFDQRYFHDEILRLRSVPLSVLEDALDAWIAAGGPDPYADRSGA